MLGAYRTIEQTISHTRTVTGVLRVSMIVSCVCMFFLDADDRERRVVALLSLRHGGRQTDFDHVLSISTKQEMILT